MKALGVALVLVLAASPVSASERALPGGNGRIAFASNRAENLQGEIYAIGVDGSGRRSLTRSVRDFESAPLPSPDGSRILFRSSRDNYLGIWVMNADGSGARSLVEGTSPSWAPDGRRIAFVDGRSGVSVLDLDGGAVRRIATGILPSWSPDGATIAFYAGFTVRVVAASGGEERRVVPGIVLGGVLAAGPAWSPDGRRLAVAGGPPDANNIASSVGVYVAPVDGGPAVRVTTGDGSQVSPAWSPDGRRIAFVRQPLQGGAFIAAVDAAGGAETALTPAEPGRSDSAPAWSPDGTRVAFARGPFAAQVFVVGADGSGLRQVTRESPHAQFPQSDGPRWLPDGRTLVYSTWLPDNDFDLFTAAPDGSAVRRLTDNAVEDAEPAWSPDGSRIAFVRRHLSGPPGRRDQNDELYVVRADGSGLRRLTRHDGEDTSPAWSPDGSRIAFVRRTGRGGLDVHVMRAEGGGVRRLTRQSSFYADPAWSPDGRTLLFADADVGNGGRVLALDLATGRTRVLSPPGETYARPDWSPRGDRIAFVKVTPCGGSCQLTDVWTMGRDGGGARELTKGATHVAWSPDGTLLLLDAGTADVVRADGSGRAHVTPETGAHDATPVWQPRCTRTGTARGDRLVGGAGRDLLCGLAGDDVLHGGGGSDRLFGAEGDDSIDARDGAFDVVGCGPGRDAVRADRRDLVGADCERVSRSSPGAGASGGAPST